MAVQPAGIHEVTIMFIRNPGHAGLVFACAMLTACVGAPQARAEAIRCPDVKDVWVSAIPREDNDSMGRTDTLKLKVLQELAVLGFDVSGLKGRRVKSAELFVRPVEDKGQKFVEGRATNLRWIVVSTVSSHWEEGGQEKSYQPDPQGHGATYREASTGQKPWAWPGSTLSDVINGNLNSVYSVGELVPAENGYWKVPVEAKVVETLAAGLSDGLSVMDGSTTHTVNSYIYSREAKGKEPYLLVEVDGEQAGKIDTPEIVDTKANLSQATPDAGALTVNVKTPKEAIGFRVKVDGQLLEPWQVARPANPGAQDVITLQVQPAGKHVKVAVAAVDAAGNVSGWAEATGKVSEKVAVPQLPKFPFEPRPGEPKKAGDDLVVWAFPEIVEVDPVTAEPMFEKDKQGFRKANPVWSGREGKIRVAAGKGEIVAFQLGIEQQGKSANAQVDVEVRGPGGESLGSQNIRLYRVWYVPSGGKGEKAAQSQPAQKRWNPEYVIPITAGKVQVPMPDNKIPNQKLQAVYVDLVIPGNAQAGTYSGQVRVRSDGGEAVLPLELVVYPVRIPKELNFNPELNCYGGPAKAGSKQFFDWHRLAHYNRCTLNRVAYSQTSQVHDDMVPKITGEGADLRVADWTEYDKRVGPLLDGSAFQGLPRDGVPVRTFYLPFFESWPVRMEGHYQMGMPPAGKKAQGRQEEQDSLLWKGKHDLTVKPVDQAFDQEYKDGFVNIVSQFCKHYDQKGWTKTLCELYQNNKYGYYGTWWTLDEPTEWADWNALCFFGRLFNRGISAPHAAKFVHRGDISRPQWQAGFMDGCMDIMYSGSAAGLSMPRLMMHIKQRTGMILYMYGSCNPVERNSLESAAWCLKAFSVGADGVSPWQSIGNDKALDEPDNTGLLVTGNRFGTTAVASIRTLAMRHGAQQCELLKQVIDRHAGWNCWHAYALVTQKVPLTAVLNLKNVDEASAASFGEMTSGNFLELKEGLLQMLSEHGGNEAGQPTTASR